jgi:putative tricarboxylic transport membrane protein
MKEENMPRADFLTSILLLVFGIAVLIVSIKMPRFETMGVNPYSVPGIVPGFLGVAIAFLSLILFIRSIIQKGYRVGLTKEVVKGFLYSDSTRRFLLSLALCVTYGVFLLGRIPYHIATGLFVLVFIIAFEFEFKESLLSQRKTIISSLAEAVLVSAGVTFLFRYLFLVKLP